MPVPDALPYGPRADGSVTELITQPSTREQCPSDASSVASGDVRTFQTSLRRDLGERHVNMIAFSAALGVGLFLQAGRVIYQAGPGMAVVCYFLTGTIMWSMMAALGEMTALFPVQGPIFEFQARFLDESIGFAAAWMEWFAWSVLTGVELLAVAQLWDFEFDPAYLASIEYPYPDSLNWATGQGTSPAVWTGIFLFVVGLPNLLPVKYYGKLEYFFGCVKMIFLVGLILLNVIVNAMQAVPHPSGSHFWAYNEPYAGFIASNFTLEPAKGSGHPGTVVTGPLGQLAAAWNAMTIIVFSMIGFDTTAITAAENMELNRTETVKLSARKISLRVVLLYCLCTFVVGLNISYTDPELVDFGTNSIRSGQHSVFILAAVRNHLAPGWPGFFNGFMIFSAAVSGMNAIYNSSRILHALACVTEAWPWWAESVRWRLARTNHGVPMGAVGASWLFSMLGFLSANDYPSIVLGRMATNSVVSVLIVYCTICAAYLVFYRAIEDAANGKNPHVSQLDFEAYNREHKRYPYRSHGQYLRTWYALVGCALFALFNGWNAFTKPFVVEDFIASYISILIFVLLVVLYHIKSQGWNPLRWHLHPTMDLRNPMRVASAKNRRGQFPKLQKGQPRENLRLVGEWVWVWLQ